MKLSLIFRVLAVFVGLLSALPFLVTLLLLYTPRSWYFPYNRSPEESGITRYEDHSIRATDGVVIQARLFHSLKEAEILALSPPLPHITFNSSNKDATVVVVHGHGANMGRQVEVDIHSLIHRTVRPLLAAGFTVMAIDLRNHGRSGVSLPITFGLQEKHDVLGSVDWIIENADKFGLNPRRIGLWGESMGGTTVLQAATDPKFQADNVRAVFTDSAFASMPLVIPTWFKEKLSFGFPEWLINAMLEFSDYMSNRAISQNCVLTALDTMHNVTASAVQCKPACEDCSEAPLAKCPTHKIPPMFVAHGRSDSIVLFNNAELLVTALKKYAVVGTFFHEHGHVRAYHDERYFSILVDFFETNL